MTSAVRVNMRIVHQRLYGSVDYVRDVQNRQKFAWRILSILQGAIPAM